MRINYISFPFCTWSLVIQDFIDILLDRCISLHFYIRHFYQIHQGGSLKEKERKTKNIICAWLYSLSQLQTCVIGY